jgi:intracellular sulfur oxidation DsrE/DsrF family protein
MIARRIGVAMACAVVLGAASPAWAQLPVAGVDAARDIPGAKETIDPAREYKVLFMVAESDKPDTANRLFGAAGVFVNTLAKAGVPPEQRKIVLMIHGGMDVILDNEAYRKKHDGKDNPALAMIQALSKGGVSVRACGQGVAALKYEPKDILPEVQTDLWAMTTAVNLGLQGYVRVGQ